MIAIIFAKKSQRLSDKHSMDLCGERIIDRVSRIILESHLLQEIILFTKDSSLSSKYCTTEDDTTDGILLDSILYCIGKYREFLAVGGDMPYIDITIIDEIVRNYSGTAITCKSDGFYQPLFTVYNKKLYKSMKEFRNSGGESMSRFLGISDLQILNFGSDKLRSINYMSDLNEARRTLCGKQIN
jgi:molybdopterin-guanine dinucleotide biosynthesis protein A